MTVQKEGNRKVERKVKYYNLDMQKQIKEMVAENFQQTIQDSFQNKLNKQMQNFTETMKGKLR